MHVAQEKLISSISSQFGPSMQSRTRKEAFVNKCGEIVNGLRTTLSTKQASLAQKEAMRDQRQAAYQELIEEQRAYFRAVKDFQVACDRNEQLLQRVQASRNA